MLITGVSVTSLAGSVFPSVIGSSSFCYKTCQGGCKLVGWSMVDSQLFASWSVTQVGWSIVDSQLCKCLKVLNN